MAAVLELFFNENLKVTDGCGNELGNTIISKYGITLLDMLEYM